MTPVKTVEKSAAATPEVPGLATSLIRAALGEGMRQRMVFRCRAHDWSPDVAAWVTEVFVDALRAGRDRARAGDRLCSSRR
ncbi:hypothetical protein NRF20_43780 [Streptomyces sp. R-74717]|uniref:hypothetical protein n=1 Tax=Streptomyces TaxID=1883 RepID=UPI00378E16B4